MTLRVQVPNNHILTPNLYYNYYYPNPKYPNIGYMDPLGDLRFSNLRGPRHLWPPGLKSPGVACGLGGVEVQRFSEAVLRVYRGFAVFLKGFGG